MLRIVQGPGLNPLIIFLLSEGDQGLVLTGSATTTSAVTRDAGIATPSVISCQLAQNHAEQLHRIGVTSIDVNTNPGTNNNNK